MDDVNINRAVHEALGFCWHENGTNIAGYYHCGKCVGIIPLKYSTSTEGLNPDYSTDLNAAMKFAEKLIADGWEFILSLETKNPWNADFYRNPNISHESYAPSSARAICIAGLAALGIEPQSQPDGETQDSTGK